MAEDECCGGFVVDIKSYIPTKNLDLVFNTYCSWLFVNFSVQCATKSAHFKLSHSELRRSEIITTDDPLFFPKCASVTLYWKNHTVR